MLDLVDRGPGIYEERVVLDDARVRVGPGQVVALVLAAPGPGAASALTVEIDTGSSPSSEDDVPVLHLSWAPDARPTDETRPRLAFVGASPGEGHLAVCDVDFAHGGAPGDVEPERWEVEACVVRVAARSIESAPVHCRGDGHLVYDGQLRAMPARLGDGGGIVAGSVPTVEVEPGAAATVYASFIVSAVVGAGGSLRFGGGHITSASLHDGARIHHRSGDSYTYSTLKVRAGFAVAATFPEDDEMKVGAQLVRADDDGASRDPAPSSLVSDRVIHLAEGATVRGVAIETPVLVADAASSVVGCTLLSRPACALARGAVVIDTTGEMNVLDAAGATIDGPMAGNRSLTVHVASVDDRDDLRLAEPPDLAPKPLERAILRNVDLPPRGHRVNVLLAAQDAAIFDPRLSWSEDGEPSTPGADPPSPSAEFTEEQLLGLLIERTTFGSVRSMIGYRANEARRRASASRTERFLLGLYRLLGHGRRPGVGALAWVSAVGVAVLLRSADGVQARSFDDRARALLETALPPITVITRTIPATWYDLAARVVVSLAFGVLVVAVSRFGRINRSGP